MKKILALTALAAFVFVGCTKQAPVEEKAVAPVDEQTMETTPSVSPESDAMMAKEGVKEFTVVGDNFAFDVKEMKVKKGDTVRVTFENKEGTHDWVVDEFEARTKMLQAGEKETIEFTADEAGEFEYYCSYMQHRKMGMVGKLIVEE